ncbi:hypothetical protein HispidOSU_026922 [Sigmodon hispidus]
MEVCGAPPCQGLKASSCGREPTPGTQRARCNAAAITHLSLRLPGHCHFRPPHFRRALHFRPAGAALLLVLCPLWSPGEQHLSQ